MLTLFPGEKPYYVDENALDGFCAKVIFTEDENYISFETVISRDGISSKGKAIGKNKTDWSTLEYRRKCQKYARLSFYRAAVPTFISQPPWGALTGIRPGRFITDMLLDGKSDTEALATMEKELYVTSERAKMALQTAKASIKVQESLFDKDICIYIGIPFCPTRCSYCSFVSNSVDKSAHMIEPYLSALFSEIEQVASIIGKASLRIISIYIGGGTPTTLAARQLEALTSKIENHFDLSNLREYTVEAGRPDTITKEKLNVMQRKGVSRISINPQSMDDKVLSAIGRHHNSKDIIRALEMTQGYGFDINMDVIAGLPDDTPDGFSRTLDTLVSLYPDNITIHTLALKKGSKIMTENTRIPIPQAVGEMLQYAQATLSTKGYNPYYLYRQKYISGGFENVGYSLPEKENIYNVCIMEELCSIISMGAGGSTKLVTPGTGNIKRIFNPKYPYEYINREKDKDQILQFYNI